LPVLFPLNALYLENNLKKMKINKVELTLVVTGLLLLCNSRSKAKRENKKLTSENESLKKEIDQLEGQLENQKWVIEGQQRTIERVSYINGKYCKFNR
jgi:peptidoglycan hydrolase CwlO-like protein